MPIEKQIKRHFTATGFIIERNNTLLHWHRKIQAWLPPGGHIIENEDPVQAVIREIYEETGIEVSIVGNQIKSNFKYPKRIFSPMAILIEDIHDPDIGYHQHIDLIYACKPKHEILTLSDKWLWISKDMLMSNQSLGLNNEQFLPPPDDVRELALEAFEIVTSKN